jgi:hypothetical protein
MRVRREIMSFVKKFTQHPASVGESYAEHFGQAMRFSGKMLVGAFCCAVHAVFPFLFEKTGSTCITELHDRMVANRDRRERADSEFKAETV